MGFVLLRTGLVVVSTSLPSEAKAGRLPVVPEHHFWLPNFRAFPFVMDLVGVFLQVVGACS